MIFDKPGWIYFVSELGRYITHDRIGLIHTFKRAVCWCVRPYHVESTSSRLITEVKQHWVVLVLGWVTAWEYTMLYAFWRRQTAQILDKTRKSSGASIRLIFFASLEVRQLGQRFYEFSGEVSRSWRYCNARPTRDRAGASSWTLSPYKNQFNIEEGTWPSYQILSW